MKLFGFPTFAAIGKLRKMLALFKKEKTVLFLLTDITGTVSDGLKKEVESSISKKADGIVSELRKSI